MRSRVLGFGLVVLLLAAPLGAQTGPPSPYVPGRIIVKMDPAQSQTCMHCAFLHGLPMPAGIAVLHQQWGVTGIEHLHDAFHALTVGDMVSNFDAQVANARLINPARVARESPVDPTPLVEEVLNTYVVELPADTDPEQAAAAYRTNPAVLDAHPDYNAHLLQYIPNDQFYVSKNSWGQGYDDLWGIKMTGAQGAWQHTRGAGIRIAVQDSGQERLHPDLGGRLCQNTADPPDGVDNDGNGYKDDVYCGYNFAQKALGGASGCPRISGAVDYANPCDQDGHGSHTAGTALAQAFNGGVVGMAPEALLQPFKIFGLFGAAPTSGIYNSYLYAITSGTDVVNASWGCTGTACGLSTYLTLDYIYGILNVAAAGNRGIPVDDEPALDDNVVFTVGAHDQNGNWSNFSSYGGPLDLVAPGGGSLQTCSCGGETDYCATTTRNILSARSFLVTPNDKPGCTQTNDLVPFNGNWLLEAGTSMAAPHVSGAVALMMSALPWMNLQDIQHALRHAAVDVRTAGIGVDALTGWGRLNIAKAIGNTYPVLASEDAWVDNSQKNKNFGNGDRLRVDGQNPRRIIFLKFDLRNVAAHQGATLRICTRENATSGGGGKVYLVDATAWSEYGVTWNNKPALGSLISGTINEPVYGNAPASMCLDADITPYVHPKQINSFAIAKDNDAADGLAYFSREGAGATDKGPHLVLTTCQPTGCRTCDGATVVEANVQLLPLALSVVLYRLYERRRRRHANRSRARAS